VNYQPTSYTFTINGKPVSPWTIQARIYELGEYERQIERARSFTKFGGLLWRFLMWAEGILRKDREWWVAVQKLDRLVANSREELQNEPR